MLLCPFFIRHENSTLTGDISNALANGVGFKTVAIGVSDPAVDPKTWFILVTSFQWFVIMNQDSGWFILVTPFQCSSL